MSKIFAELKLRLGEANSRSRTYRTASGVEQSINRFETAKNYDLTDCNDLIFVFDFFAFAPKPLQVIKQAGFVVKNVKHNVAEVQNRPSGVA